MRYSQDYDWKNNEISFKFKIHFVNWNNQKYEKMSDASVSTQHDGLLVLGVLVEVKQ
jgi:hypothetical protein